MAGIARRQVGGDRLQRAVCLFVCPRQPQFDRGPRAELAADTYGAAGLCGKALNHRQAETRAAARFLRRKEWFECTRKRRLVHSRAGVSDREDDIIPGWQFRWRFGAGALVLQIDVQCTAAGHGVAGVDCQVEDCELELIGIDQCRREIGAPGDGEAGVVAQRPTQQIFDAGEQTAQIDGLGIETRRPCPLCRRPLDDPRAPNWAA